LSELLLELTAAGTAPDFHRIPYYDIWYLYVTNITFSGGKENYFIFTAQKITIIISEGHVLYSNYEKPLGAFFCFIAANYIGSVQKVMLPVCPILLLL